jgi:tetratricopeptide (TPR) repeat protein
MAAPDDDIRDGLAQQRAGNWSAALECYLKAVEGDPGNSQGLFRAGIAQAHEGRLDLSGELLKRCVAAEPGFADAAKALGGVLLSQAKYQEAAEALEKACALSPDSATAYCDLGAALVALQQLEHAAASYTRAIVLRPGFAEAHNKLGNIQRHLGELDRAVLSYRRAIKAEPKHAHAWYNLAVTLQVQEKFPKALDAYRQALALAPDNASAENNMGLVLMALGRNAEAGAAFRRALALKPDYALALINLGAILQLENKPGEAIAVIESVLALTPDDPRPLTNMGNAYIALNRPAEGLAAYGKALAIEPGLSEVRYNAALAHLVTGDMESGWAGYDSRLETEAHRRKYPFEKARWRRGEPVEGKSVLVYAEQGLGDTIQFARYIPLLEATGARVIVRVQVSLKSLLSHQLGTATVISTKDPVPEHDFQCSLLSLPREFGTRLDSIPSRVPYLVAPQAKTEAWRKVFAHAPGLKVGLVWSGNPKHQFDHNRSLPIELLPEITAGMPAHFFAIQKEFRGTDREKLAGMPQIHDLSRKIVSFEDTAAIVTALDLVITVDTSVAHLAGSLGAKAWVMLGFAPDWRWLLDRSDSPWYPSLRLFRQPALGDWGAVIRDIRVALGPGTLSAPGDRPDDHEGLPPLRNGLG